MTTTTPAPEAVPAVPQKKRLTTSAMIASFADPGQKTAPAPFGHALARLAEERPEIVGLSADLAKYTDMHIFRDAHPQRFFQMGMAEQAMLGAAAGMAEVGLVPFASTYSVFATRRAYDFLCLDIAEPNLNVNVVGALPGLTTGYGPSHQATEDLAILRGCPNLTIVDPCDSVDIEQSVPQLAAHAGPTYLRLLRGQVPTVLDEYGYRFQLGKAAELRTGRDVVLISTGLMTMRALQAAARLEANHVDVAVLHVPTIKPLDREAILRAARTDRLVVTLENHTVIGGLSEAVASTIAYAGVGTRVVPIALPDEFLAAGALPTLHDRYGLSTDAIISKVKAEMDAHITGTDDLGANFLALTQLLKDEHRCQDQQPGEQPQAGQGGRARGQPVGQGRGGEQSGPGQHERPPAPAVGDPARPGAQEEGRQAEGGHDQPDGHVTGPQRPVGVPGHGWDEHAVAGKVGQRGQGHGHERRGEQGGTGRGRPSRRSCPDHRQPPSLRAEPSVAARARPKHR